MNPETTSPNDNHTFYGYAGFWKRFAAAFIDTVILWFVFGVVLNIVFQALEDGLAVWTVIAGVIAWLYFAIFESSPAQATPGKMAIGIKVTDVNSGRISFGRASGRYFGKILSFLSLCAGYIMAAFTQKKQGLHDIVAGCLVVNKSATPRTALTIIISVIGVLIYSGILSAALCPPTSSVLQANMAVACIRGKDIYVAIVRANTEREPLGLGTVWPKTGVPPDEIKGEERDIGEMTFTNSSDYFTILLNAENMETEDWAPYVAGVDYSRCAGAGIPFKKGTGHLTAENNIWTIAANITDDMPGIIPVLISRNVDPDSLIPREGDLSKQLIRPSEFKTPFGGKGIVLIRKDGSAFKCRPKYANLKVIYQNASEEELQKIRDAFQKVEYLTP